MNLNTDPIFNGVTVPEVIPGVTTPPAPTLPTILVTPFITIEEMGTHIYDGVQQAIADGSTTMMAAAINAATNEVMGYLSRFDFVTILSQTAGARDPLLLQYLKDISVWHFIVIANPNIDYEVRLDRYKYAIRWLEKIQDARFVPAGWPPTPVTILSNEFHVRSQPKRNNNY